jgi:hypothetical protein
MTNSLLITSGGFFQLSASEAADLLGIDRVSYAKLQPPAGITLSFILLWVVGVCALKAPILRLLSLVATDASRRRSRLESYERLKQWLFNARFIMRWAG